MTKNLDKPLGRLGATVAGTDPCSTGGHPKLQSQKRRLQMNKFRLTIKLVAIAIFTLAFASMAHAQASRTWVSGVGDDANPCSRTAPCKTFAGAISKTADGGEIDALDPGGFGAVTITKGITLDGGGGQVASVLVSGTNGIVVNDSTNTKVITLRNLRINGIGTGLAGINVLAALRVNVQNCIIFGFTQQGIVDQRTGSGDKLSVIGCLIHNNTLDGIHVGPIGGGSSTVVAQIANTTLTSNNQNGIFIKGNGGASITNVNVLDSQANGIQIDTGAVAVIVSSVMVGNSTGLSNSGGATKITDCTIANNNTGVSISAGTVTGFSNNTISNNGVGDVITSSVVQK
jgi:hypothetical protein